MEKTEQKPLMTAREVSILLGKTLDWVYRYGELGRLGRVRMGGQWRYKRDEVERVAREGTEEPTE